MLYITSRNEKLGDPINSDFIGDEQQFFQSNRHLAGFKKGSLLPPYTPIITSNSDGLKEYGGELYQLPYATKERLWQLQENKKQFL